MMIVSVLNGSPVEVEGASRGVAGVVSLGRNNLGQHYVGGMGYMGTKAAYIEAAALTSFARIDPENCPEYQAWQAAIKESDSQADDNSPATAAALELEEKALQAFIKFIHANSLHRVNTAREITPNLPLKGSDQEEQNAAQLFTSTVALYSAGSAR